MAGGAGGDRYWEVDGVRGTAILMMIAFHVAYDLDHFGGARLAVDRGFWWALARLTAFLFLLLVGVSLTLSYARASSRLSPGALRQKYVRRGLTLFFWGLLVTAVTWMVVPEGVIVFGVLHFIGVAVILAYPLLRCHRANLVLAIACMAVGAGLEGVTTDTPLLLWLGIPPEGFYTFDYFPLFPWFGVVCLGLFVGTMLYPRGRRVFALPDWSRVHGVRELAYLGRHSLAIYLLHQPVLVALLWMAGAIDPGFYGF